MSAGRFVIKARREGAPRGSLNRGICCCHPRAWGAKKGLRRARRRVDKEIVRRELSERG
jgi:hypothetical protein